MDGSSVIDERVIDRAARGDKEAFSVIVRCSGARVLLVAERILKSPEEAVSAVQTLFVKAFSGLTKLKNTGFLETWLLQTLVGVCGDRLEQKDDTVRTVFVQDNPVVDTRVAAGVAATQPSPVERALTHLSRVRARGKQVRQVIDSLSFKERTAVMFRDWDGVSTIEVAEILRTDRDDVRQLLVSARKTLADTLEVSAGRCSSDHPQGVANSGTTPVKNDNRPVGPVAKSSHRAACGKNSERLWLFVGGELGQKEQTDLVRHLDDCPACRESLARASAVLEAIRDAAPVEDGPPIAPEQLWKGIEPLLA